MLVACLHRLEQRGAQRRREGQGHEGRKTDGGHHHGRKLAVDVAGGTGKKGQRHEHRDQHHGHADNRARNLAHGFACGLQWRQAFFAHDALDVFHHHDGVIHHDADDQHHAKHGQHVDGKAQGQQGAKGAQQCDGHHEGGNDGVAPVLQEQKHHQEHQHYGFKQGLYHLADGDADEVRAVVGNRPGNVLGKQGFELGNFCAHVFRCLQSVARGGQLHAHAHSRFAVQACRGGVGLAAQFNACDIAQPHGGAVGVGAQHDVAKLLHAAELALHYHGGADGLAVGDGQVTHHAAGYLGVLRPNGRRHVAGSELKACELGRINPDAHGALGAKNLHLPNAGQPLNFWHDVARNVVS